MGESQLEVGFCCEDNLGEQNAKNKGYIRTHAHHGLVGLGLGGFDAAVEVGLGWVGEGHC
jgi:hypothetical protein